VGVQRISTAKAESEAFLAEYAFKVSLKKAKKNLLIIGRKLKYVVTYIFTEPFGLIDEFR
jgi:CO dehydrogenase/acetyl-CoA synthase epsilon subunit